MRVVTVSMVRVVDHLFDGNDAALMRVTAIMFKLDGGVRDVEFAASEVLQMKQNALALRWGNVCNADVAGQRAGL